MVFVAVAGLRDTATPRHTGFIFYRAYFRIGYSNCWTSEQRATNFPNTTYPSDPRITSYEDKPVTYFNFGRMEMLPFVPGNARTLLEIGCGEGEFSANLKLTRPLHITGIEPFSEAAGTAKTRLDRVLVKNVEAGLDDLAGESCDCIFCNDVLEHLVDPWVVLRRLKPFIAPGGVLVASLPNMRFMPVFKALVLHGNWQYVDMGVMDRTHLRFFTLDSMKSMFKDCGFTVATSQGINAIQLPWKFSLLNKLVFNRLSDTRYQHFAIVAKL